MEHIERYFFIDNFSAFHLYLAKDGKQRWRLGGSMLDQYSCLEDNVIPFSAPLDPIIMNYVLLWGSLGEYIWEPFSFEQ